MTALFSVLPIIMMAIIFGIVIFTITKSKPSEPKPRKLTQKRKSIIKGYMIILLASALVYVFLQNNRDVIGDTQRNHELKQINREFTEAIKQGDFDHSVVKEEQEWIFSLEDNEVMLTNLNEGSGLSFIVYVEKVEGLDEEMTATYYTKNVGKKRVYHPDTPVILWDEHNQELQLRQYEKNVKVHAMSKEFPIRQFTGERWFGERQGPTFNVHDQVLYVRVPTGTEVETSHFLYVHEVN